MEKEEFNKILTNLLKSNNFEEDIKKLSFGDKYLIYTMNGNSFLANQIIRLCKVKKVKLFSLEEFETFIEIHGDIDFEDDKLIRQLYRDRNIFNFPSKLDPIFIEKFKSNHFEYLKCVSNEENIIKLINESDKHMRDYIFTYISDEMREKLLLSGKLDKYKSDIILNFRTKEMVAKYYSKASKDVQKRIAYMLEDNELIKSHIGINTLNTTNLVSKLSNDEDKKMYLRKYFLLFSRPIRDEIICSLSDKDKEYYLKKYSMILNNDSRSEIIRTFEDPEYIIRNANLIKGHVLANMISYLPFDNKEAITKLYEMLDEQTISECSSLIIKIDKILPEEVFKNIHSKKVITHILDHLDIKELSKESLDSLLDKVDANYLNWYVKRDDRITFDFRILLRCTDEEAIIKKIEESQSYQEYSEEFRPLFEIVARHYNLNLDHLLELAKLCGCLILDNIKDENILAAINLSDESFKKYMQIFSSETMDYTKGEVSDVLNALLQQDFGLRRRDDAEIRINTIRAFSKDGNYTIGVKNIKKIASVVDLSDKGIDEETLIRGLVNADPIITKKFDEIANVYVILKRNEYVNRKLDESFDRVLPWTYDDKRLLKYFFNTVPSELIYKTIMVNFESLNPEMKRFAENDELLKSMIDLMKNPSNFAFSQREVSLNRKLVTPEMRENMKLFSDICIKILYPYVYRNKIEEKIPKKYEFPKVYSSQLIELMSNIDVSRLDEVLIKANPELFEEMLGDLKRYKMIGFGNKFDEIGEECDCEFEPGNIGAFIAYYDFILKEIQETKDETTLKKQDSLLSKLAISSGICAESNVYTMLFGFEDYKLLKINPNPNKAKATRKERFNKAVNLLNVLHSKKYIPIPPMDEEIELSSGKSIRVVVGNTNDSINLTFGERTGSCMRVKGAGRDLFNFCLNSENGVHIGFYDSEMESFVSRGSCIVSGNSMFINEERAPRGHKYSRNDIKEAFEIIGRMVIERTQSSNHPVENVISSPHYILEGAKTVDLGCEDIRKGFKERIYCDIEPTNAVVVATSSKDGPFVPVTLNPNAVEKYETIRARIKHIGNMNESNDAIKRKVQNEVAHIEALDMFFDGVNIEEIEVTLKDVVEAYTGEDWYVAMLEDGNIITYIQKNSKDVEKAKKEVEEYLTKMKKEVKKEDNIEVLEFSNINESRGLN